MATEPVQIDRFIMIHAGRNDAWRDLTHSAEAWARGKADRKAVEEKLARLLPTEEFFAYPSHSLLAGLQERVARDDAAGAVALLRRISGALLTR
ncbi:MAG: hypothetical protein LW837_22820, partial [Roseomonas sp.]|nr:hypothetical protein [Roseomonas sp.]MCE2922758.1 hypothetical protein [Roseomonas sp.]